MLFVKYIGSNRFINGAKAAIELKFCPRQSIVDMY